MSDTTTGMSRRRVLGLGGAAAGAGVATALLRADSANALTTSPFLYNVKEPPYNATGNGATDDTAAINTALTAAGAAGGGIVFLPPGNYRVHGTLNIPGAVWLQGVGFVANENAVPLGSVLYGTNPAASMVRMNGRGAHISDIAFHQPQNPAAPTVYQPAIAISASDATMERLFLYNVYDGIVQYVAAGLGRMQVQQVVGQPLNIGIRINGATDTTYVNDIHFWPYTGTWSWTRTNGIGILSEKNDNPFFANIFCFGYSIGMKLASSPNGNTQKMRLSNADFDDCGVGLWMDNGSTAMVTNLTHAIGTTGVIVYNGSVLQLVNARCSTESTNGIRVGSASQCYVDNVIVEAWNTGGGGFPGIENVGGAATVVVGRTRAFGAGNGAPTMTGCTLDA